MVNRAIRVRSRPAFALVDVIVATIILGASLVVLISLSARAISSQSKGEELATAAHMADEQLNLVLSRGPDNYSHQFPADGACDPPFDKYHFHIDIGGGSTTEPYRVSATITWNSGSAKQSITIDTLMAGRDTALDGIPDPVRRPDPPVVRTQ